MPEVDSVGVVLASPCTWLRFTAAVRTRVIAQRHLHAHAMERIHPDGPDIWAQPYYAVDREWAATVDDVVRRRTTLAVRGLASPALKAEIARAIPAVG